MNILRVNVFLGAALMAVGVGCNKAPEPQAPAKTAAVSPATQPQAKTSITPSPGESPEQPYATDAILTCTVSECWQLAGRNEEKFFDIVQQLSVLSAEHRHLLLPESEEAGRKAGEFIKAEANKDRGQLLYAVVDAAVRKVGTPSGK